MGRWQTKLQKQRMEYLCGWNGSGNLRMVRVDVYNHGRVMQKSRNREMLLLVKFAVIARSCRVDTFKTKSCE